MGRLKILSGQEVWKILSANGFEQVRQKGSHIIMQKKINNTTITVPVPNHPEIKLAPCSQSSGKVKLLKTNLKAINYRWYRRSNCSVIEWNTGNG